jgi:hypothetical protein
VADSHRQVNTAIAAIMKSFIKKGNLCGNILISINFGVLEFWSIGVMLNV